MTAAFDGIRILDFTQVFAGPFAVMQLALLGADVIKVEQPVTGDQTRVLMNEGEDFQMSPAFMGMNLNKRSLTLNLKDETAKDIIRKLLPSVDVIVENFKAGTMQRHDLDYETLRQLKPDLVYCSITGYGQSGPKAGEAAYDGAIQAASGMMSQNGHPETGPTRTGYMPVDMSTALNTAFAISAALHRKATTGEGQYLDVAMLDTAIIMQASLFSNYLNQGTLIGLRGNASPTRQPTADVFPTSDGHIQITAIRQPQVETLFTELGLAQMLEDDAFATQTSRINHPEAIFDAMSRKLKQQTTQAWIKRLAPVSIPVAEVRELADVARDPDLMQRNALVTLPSPLDPRATVTVAKAGYVTNVDGPEVRSGPPVLGADTDDILTELGFETNEIERLRNAGVI